MANNGLHTPPHTVLAGTDNLNETPDFDIDPALGRNNNREMSYRLAAPSPTPTRFVAARARRAIESMPPAASDEEVVEWEPSSPESPSPAPLPQKNAKQETAATDVRPSIEVPMGTSLEAVMMLPTQGPSETSEEPKVPDNDDDKDDDKDIREGNREDSEKTTVKKCVAVKK
ncbi:hypothetical protein N0V85_008703, partial [Neurospora sp. IMI 360204]